MLNQELPILKLCLWHDDDKEDDDYVGVYMLISLTPSNTPTFTSLGH